MTSTELAGAGSPRSGAPSPQPRRTSFTSVLEFATHHWLRGWAAITHLVVDLLVSLPAFVLIVLTFVGIVLAPVLLIGVPFLAITLAAAAGIGYLERARVQALLGVVIPVPARPAGQPLWKRMLLDGRSWRAMLYLTILTPWGFVAGLTITALASIALAAATVPLYAWALPGGLLTLPWDARIGGVWWLLLVFGIGVAGLIVVPLLAQVLVQADLLLARWCLGPGRAERVASLDRRVQTLTRTRKAAVDSVETERRRIERDLHDGPQQRLVAIAMDLGMAQQRMEQDPAAARELLDKAHAAAKAAVVEMRQVARGIHPPVLTDRGLDAALSALAAGSAVPVTVDVDLPSRPSPTVEAIAYFCVSEALTNVAKHARANAAQVRVRALDGGVRIEVRDNGIGGADPDGGGTGLAGLADRVHAIDGGLQVSSPPGGPTVLTVQLPFQTPPERSR